jgi:hypothetical protein
MIMNVLATNSRKRLRSRARNRENHETPHSYTFSDCGVREHRVRSHVSSGSNSNVQEIAGRAPLLQPGDVAEVDGNATYPGI